MVDFTVAYNNLINLYNCQNRDVIQYQFVLHNHQINVAYTNQVGLSRQISVTFETPDLDVIFLPIRIVKQADKYFISAHVGEYMSLLYPFFINFRNENNKMSTTLFFDELAQRIENLNINELRYENLADFGNHIRKAKHPKDNKDDYYNPYFFNIIHKNLSDRMKTKIYEIYDNPKEIILFLKHNGLTLAFTEDISKARDFYTVFNQRKLELETKY